MNRHSAVHPARLWAELPGLAIAARPGRSDSLSEAIPVGPYPKPAAIGSRSDGKRRTPTVRTKTPLIAPSARTPGNRFGFAYRAARRNPMSHNRGQGDPQGKDVSGSNQDPQPERQESAKSKKTGASEQPTVSGIPSRRASRGCGKRERRNEPRPLDFKEGRAVTREIFRPEPGHSAIAAMKRLQTQRRGSRVQTACSTGEGPAGTVCT